jgi:pyruvate/2-oxoglutarate dehydrogenase complex dihydrolipoamide dehydrogenase (E3) component
MSRYIVVIGGGPAGIEAARAAAAAGGHVTLVSDEPVGGRAGWHSLLPSKVWLTAADTFGLLTEAPSLGIAVDGTIRADPSAIVDRIRAVKEAWAGQQVADLKALGVELVAGVGSFEAADRVAVADGDGDVLTRLQADAVIVAAGSVPRFPPEMKPDGQRILAPRFASHLASLPPDIVVVGGGATGSEFTYLFNRLGVKVTWIVAEQGVLPKFAPSAGPFLAEALVRRGVRLVQGQMAARIEREPDGVTLITTDGARYSASTAFVAIGRLPDLSRLNLGAAGLRPGPGGGLQPDSFGRTAVPTIYAVGDASGMPMLANRATAQAWIAGRHAAGATTSPFRPETVIHAIYTEPQVAQVGVLDANGAAVEIVRLPFTSSLKAHLLPEGDGFLELAYNVSDRRVMGSVAVGPHAADVLTPVALAIQMELSLDDLARMYAAHPTLSELAFMVARLA